MKNPINEFIDYYRSKINECTKIEFQPERLKQLKQLNKEFQEDITLISVTSTFISIEISLVSGRVQDGYLGVDGKQTLD